MLGEWMTQRAECNTCAFDDLKSVSAENEAEYAKGVKDPEPDEKYYIRKKGLLFKSAGWSICNINHPQGHRKYKE